MKIADWAEGIEMEVGGAALRALRLEAESRGQKSEVGGQKAKSIELVFVCGSFLPFPLFSL